MAIPYLSWNSGVLCKNSNPGWVAKSSLKTGLKSSYIQNIRHVMVNLIHSRMWLVNNIEITHSKNIQSWGVTNLIKCKPVKGMIYLDASVWYKFEWPNPCLSYYPESNTQ